jgi:hypothetical protein
VTVNIVCNTTCQQAGSRVYETMSSKRLHTHTSFLLARTNGAKLREVTWVNFVHSNSPE